MFTRMLREAPLEPYASGRVVPQRTRVLPWRRVLPSVAALLLVVTTASALVARAPGPGREEQPRTFITPPAIVSLRTANTHIVDPVTLPLGQRSARDDF